MSTLAGTTQATFAATLVDEWARCGIRQAVVCPGSRSAPLALVLAADPRIEVIGRLDERSAGFVALGAARMSGRAVVVLTTSGTAAAELHPAVVEASHSRVPLVVCTADRPPELQQVGAPQAIEQHGLYGGAVRFATDPGMARESSRHWWRSLAARVVAEASGNPAGPGPVHLNLPFADPLDGIPGELPPGRPGGAPWHRFVAGTSCSAGARDVLADVVTSARRPLVVAGARCGNPDRLVLAAAAARWPLVADPRSGCRRSCSAVASADALVKAPAFAASHEPDLVVRLGEAWASKALAGFLDSLDCEQVLLDPFGEWRDPGRSVSLVLRTDSDELSTVLEHAKPLEPKWSDSWRRADDRARAAIEGRLAEYEESGELTEPAVARQLAATPGVVTVVVASSMPVRDLEWFSAPSPSYPRVLSNRGANGIDGVVSTAVGAASCAARGDAVVALVGDLALLHDASALVEPEPSGAPSGAPPGIVVVDNRGGGIFSFLAQARSVEAFRFEQLFAAPQQTDVTALLAAAGYAVTVIEHPAALAGALADLADGVAGGERRCVVCRTERDRNVAVHAELDAAVAGAISA